MTTNHDNQGIGTIPAASSTERVLAELQLYGYRPFHDEPDPRPLPDAGTITGAVADIFDALLATLTDTRLEPDRNRPSHPRTPSDDACPAKPPQQHNAESLGWGVHTIKIAGASPSFADATAGRCAPRCQPVPPAAFCRHEGREGRGRSDEGERQ